MKKKDEVKKMEEVHQRKDSHMIKSAGGSAGLLHKITKPTACRGGVQVLTKDEEREEWAKHWQCGVEVQNLEKLSKMWN